MICRVTAVCRNQDGSYDTLIVANNRIARITVKKPIKVGDKFKV